MPYKAMKRGEKWVVIAKDTGKVVGTHDGQDKAEAQVKALYANVSDAKKELSIQDLSAYIDSEVVRHVERFFAGVPGDMTVYYVVDTYDDHAVIRAGLKSTVTGSPNTPAALTSPIPTNLYYRMDFELFEGSQIVFRGEPYPVEKQWVALPSPVAVAAPEVEMIDNTEFPLSCIRDNILWKESSKTKGAGNMAGLAKHLANKYGGDPDFFTKVAGSDELARYEPEARKAIAARAHKIVTGIYPSEHPKSRKESIEKTETYGVKGWVERLFGIGRAAKESIPPVGFNDDDADVTGGRGSMVVFKDARNQDRWVAISSTAFIDRDREIVSTKALEADCDRADGDGDYGTLRWWHVPGVDIGVCDFNMVYDRVLIESGIFFDPRVAMAIKESSSDLQVSLGFTHPINEPDEQGVFHNIRRFERSILPAGYASNILTAFAVKQGDDSMTSINKKLDEFKKLLADDGLVADVIDNATKVTKAAEMSGLAYKESEPAKKDEDEEKPEAEVTEKPEAEAAETPEEKPAAEPEVEKPEPAAEPEAPVADEAAVGKEADNLKLSDLSMGQFATVLSDALASAIQPFINSAEAIQASAAKETKSRDDQITALKEALQSSQAATKEIASRLESLEGNMPKNSREKGSDKYIASNSVTNTLTAEDVVNKFKNVDMKKSTPIDDFMQFVLPTIPQ